MTNSKTWDKNQRCPLSSFPFFLFFQRFLAAAAKQKTSLSFARQKARRRDLNISGLGAMRKWKGFSPSSGRRAAGYDDVIGGRRGSRSLLGALPSPLEAAALGLMVREIRLIAPAARDRRVGLTAHVVLPHEGPAVRWVHHLDRSTLRSRQKTHEQTVS